MSLLPLPGQIEHVEVAQAAPPPVKHHFPLALGLQGMLDHAFDRRDAYLAQVGKACSDYPDSGMLK